MSMVVKLWGIRGSLPTPHTPEQIEQKMRSVVEHVVNLPNAKQKEFSVEKELSPAQLGGFGGNTACIQVSTPTTSLIIDAGSGLRRLGEQLILGPCGLGRGEVHLLMTHFHWDHLIGLPFFTPIFVAGNKLHFYAVQEDLEANIRLMFRKPNFPVPFEHLGAKCEFHRLEPRTKFMIGDLQITPYMLDHPDPCWGYRFEREGKVFVYAVDTECKRVDRQALGADLAMYQNADLMIFDAQYTFLEAAEKVDWGHSSAPIGIDLAMRENIKRVLFVHHDPAASDIKIAKAEQQTRDYYENLLADAKRKGQRHVEIKWEFAREGSVITL